MAPSRLFRRCVGRLTLSAGLLLAGVGLVAQGADRATAAESEARDFTIQVDGKPAGDYRMAIRKDDDGTVTLAAQSDVRVTVLLVTAYSYSYRGQEVWKAGKLLHFEGAGKENSKAFSVSGDAEEGGLRVKTDGKESVVRSDVWTTSCWQLPDARSRNQTVPLLGCDNGQVTAGKLQSIGSERLKIAGQEQDCTHYRLTRDVPYELWYDAQDRLVREEWVSNGHRTVLELTKVGR